MARDITALKKQYYSETGMDGMGQRPGGGGRRGPMVAGKPKNMGKTIARMLSYMKPYLGRFIIILMTMLLTTVTSLIASYLMSPIINKVALAVNPDSEIKYNKLEILADRIISKLAEGRPDILGSSVMTYIVTALLLLLCIYGIGIVCSYLQGRLMLTISLNISETLRNELFTKLQRLPIRYFDRKPTGEIMSRFTNDIDNIDMMISNSLVTLFSGLVTLIGTIYFMFATNWTLALVTIVFTPLFTFGGLAIGKASRKYYARQQAALGAVNGYMEETVTGQKVVKIFNHEDECVDEFSLLNNDMRDTQFKAQF